MKTKYEPLQRKKPDSDWLLGGSVGERDRGPDRQNDRSNRRAAREEQSCEGKDGRRLVGQEAVLQYRSD